MSDDPPDNHGRWGPDDELGTLNLITDEVRARAAAEARTGRSVSLAMPVTPTPMLGGPFASGSPSNPATRSSSGAGGPSPATAAPRPRPSGPCVDRVVSLAPSSRWAAVAVIGTAPAVELLLILRRRRRGRSPGS